MGSSKKKKPIVGYSYNMDVLFTIAVEVDEVVAMTMGDRIFWEGSANQSSTISIYKEDLFGGLKREGGVKGQIDLMFGKPDQQVNPHLRASILKSSMADIVPAYRNSFNMFFRGTDSGITTSTTWPLIGTEKELTNYEQAINNSAIFGPTPFNSDSNGFYWTSNSPYFKPPSFKLRRSKFHWYPEKATITNNSGQSKNLNPAHIIYDIFTNSLAMGYPATKVDDTRMRAAADTLYAEGFGMGVLWTQQIKIEDFLKYILQHISGVIDSDRITGKMFLKLLRNDFDINTLPIFNSDNCTLDSFSTVSPGENVNQIVVRFTNYKTGKPDAITREYMKGIHDQGQTITQTLDMLGVNDAVLADRICKRELDVRTKDLSRISITANRDGYFLQIGQPFILNFPEHGLGQIVYRVLEINAGTFEDNKVTIEAVQDVFTMPLSSNYTPQGSSWVSNNQDPIPATNYKVVEVSYYELFTQTSESDRVGLDLAYSYVRTLAAKPQNDTNGYQLLRSPTVDLEDYRLAGSGPWTPYAVLATSLTSVLQSTFTFSNGTMMDYLRPGNIGYIGNEIIQLVSKTATTMTVKRGCVDTQPKKHTAGTKIFFHADSYFTEDPLNKLLGEINYYKILTETSKGVLDPASASTISLNAFSRLNRPYPPANVRFGTQYFPDRAIGGLQLSWSHRNKELQTVKDDPVEFIRGSITPPVGLFYRLSVKNGSTEVYTTTTDTTNFDLSILSIELPNPVTIEIASLQNGLECLQPFSHEVVRVGYGLRYGQSYGGLNTPGTVIGPTPPYIDFAVVPLGNFRAVGKVNVSPGVDKILFTYSGLDRGSNDRFTGMAYMLTTDNVIKYNANLNCKFPPGGWSNFSSTDNYVVYNVNDYWGKVSKSIADTALTTDHNVVQITSWPISNIGAGNSYTRITSDGPNAFIMSMDYNRPPFPTYPNVAALATDGNNFVEKSNIVALGAPVRTSKFLNGIYWFGCGLIAGKPQAVSSTNLTSWTPHTPLTLYGSDYQGEIIPSDYFMGSVYFEVYSTTIPYDFLTFNGSSWIFWTIPGSAPSDEWRSFVTFNNKIYAFTKGKLAYSADGNSWTIVNLADPNVLYIFPSVQGSICILTAADMTNGLGLSNIKYQSTVKTSDMVTFTTLTFEPYIP